MKKLLSAALAAAILSLSIFSIGAFAESTTKTEALFDGLKQAGEATVTLSAGEVRLFGVVPVKAANTICVKGDKIAYEYGAGPLKARVVLRDGAVYGFLPFFPLFYVKYDASAFGDLSSLDVSGVIRAFSDATLGVLRFVGSYEETLDGKTYFVEEFDDRASVTSKFYYEGDSLRLLNVTDSALGSVRNTYFESISFTADDDAFEIPAAAIDLSLILKAILAAA